MNHRRSDGGIQSPNPRRRRWLTPCAMHRAYVASSTSIGRRIVVVTAAAAMAAPYGGGGDGGGAAAATIGQRHPSNHIGGAGVAARKLDLSDGIVHDTDAEQWLRVAIVHVDKGGGGKGGGDGGGDGGGFGMPGGGGAGGARARRRRWWWRRWRWRRRRR